MPAHSRTLGPVRLRGAIAGDASALRRALAGLAEGRRIVAADLSLGSWRSHAAAQAFSEQLDVELPSVALPIPARGLDGGPPSAADFASMNVDVEAQGDRLALAGYLHAEACARATRQPTLFVVIGPLAGARWDGEERFIRLLAQLLHGSGSELVLAGADASALARAREEALLACEAVSIGGERAQARVSPCLLFPGVLPPALAAECGADLGVELDGGVLIHPGARVPLAALKPAQFATAASLLQHALWLWAFLNYHGFRYHLDAARLAREAIRHFGEGGLDLALRLMERACTASGVPAARNAAQAYLGRMYLLRGMFEQAAALDPPSEGAEPRDAATLFELKGWGQVMIGQASAALRCFERAEARAGWPPAARERLYLRNIWALGLQRSGAAEEALRFEEEIRAELDARAGRGQPQDWPLTYVNAINRARLHRQLGALDQAEACFAQAFETTDGLRSESDLFYQALCWARLRAQQGRRHEALVQWISAGLWWCASEVPEAIGRRALSTLLGQPLLLEGEGREHVAEALLRGLTAAAGQAGCNDDSASNAWTPSIVGLARVAPAARGALTGVYADGIGLFACAEPLAPSLDGAAEVVLRRKLASLLSTLVPALDARRFASLLLDPGEGCDAPASARQLRIRCAFHGIREMIGSERAGEPLECAVLGWGAGVERVDAERRWVSFRRYRRPLLLDDDGARIVGRLATRETRLPWRELVGDSEKVRELIGARVLALRPE